MRRPRGSATPPVSTCAMTSSTRVSMRARGSSSRTVLRPSSPVIRVTTTGNWRSPNASAVAYAFAPTAIAAMSVSSSSARSSSSRDVGDRDDRRGRQRRDQRADLGEPAQHDAVGGRVQHGLIERDLRGLELRASDVECGGGLGDRLRARALRERLVASVARRRRSRWRRGRRCRRHRPRRSRSRRARRVDPLRVRSMPRWSASARAASASARAAATSSARGPRRASKYRASACATAAVAAATRALAIRSSSRAST